MKLEIIKRTIGWVAKNIPASIIIRKLRATEITLDAALAEAVVAEVAADQTAALTTPPTLLIRAVRIFRDALVVIKTETSLTIATSH
jgi:alpha-D-ribose 1-methylphosphonate 5-triphosphate synthase subunit PhnL